jgi:hypothetical protein
MRASHCTLQQKLIHLIYYFQKAESNMTSLKTIPVVETDFKNPSS